FQSVSPSAFQPTGSHRTVLAGSAVQANFEHRGSGPGAAHFRHLTLGDSTVLYLQGIVSVTGALSGGGALTPPIVTRANATVTAIAAGGADVAGMVFRGVTLTVGDGLSRIDSVTFEQQDPTATHLSIVHPGAAGAFTFTGVRFLTAPTTGAYVSATDAAATDGQVLTITLAGSTPADGSAKTLTSGGAVVNWTAAPVPLNFAYVSAGFGHSCGLVTSGAAYCWGAGNAVVNAFGDATSGGRTTPGPVSGGVTFTTISAGDSHSCALTAAGAAYCWGLNVRGSLGDGTLANRPTPVAVAGGLQFVALEAGGHTTCALTAAGAVYCWGRNNYGELGDGTLNDRTSPGLVASGNTFSAISVSVDSRVCAITTAGAAYCWGHNSNGEIGDGSTTDRRTPTAVAGGLVFASISTRSFNHTCAMTTGAQAYCWGRNADGELGDGTTTARLTPTAIGGGTSLASIETGTFFTCGLTSAGAAYCWGANDGGQLGDGTLTGRLLPAPVVGGLTFTTLRAGVGFVSAIATGGAAHGWGYAFSNGSTTASAVPVALGPPIPPP
ncbi:MAG: hypothetical protein OEW77_11520, partial [Gemmatimonadota bacterium]|nr:hypothetical protein [Gemmatimonadota bacterium]